MRLPWSKKPARVSIADATAAVHKGTLPFFFCFGCRTLIPERPCDACDRETEIFVVTTETDRRLLTSRLPSEGT
jgi:predicted RNA-binding protein with PUA domain